VDDVTALAGQVTELSYALDTFYFLMMGALVMWMAAGFTMLEAGLVRAKNTVEILTKNVGLYSVACIMYMLCGYSIMYPGEFEGGVFQSLTTLGSGLLGNTDLLTSSPAAVRLTIQIYLTSFSRSYLWQRRCPSSPALLPNE